MRIKLQNSLDTSPFLNTIDALQLKVARRGIHYSLDRLTPALEALKNPHLGLPKTIHIAGTNGKGSVAHYLTEILLQHNAQVLTYTSPHVQCYTERFLLNGAPISKEQFTQLFAETSIADVENKLSEYEMLTLMAFQLAHQAGVDYFILETGLGGRLDATNVVPDSMGIITDIGLDHQAILGNTLTEIAQEKAGIIKQNATIITHLDHDPNVLEVIKSQAKQQSATLHWTIPRHHYHDRNKALAYVALNEILNTDTFDHDLADLPPPFGRLTPTLYQGTPCWMDVGHNLHAVRAILSIHPHPSQWIVGMNREKDVVGILSALISEKQTVFLCEFNHSLSIKLDELPMTVREHVNVWHIGDPIDMNTLFFGSFYFIERLLKDHPTA